MKVFLEFLNCQLLLIVFFNGIKNSRWLFVCRSTGLSNWGTEGVRSRALWRGNSITIKNSNKLLHKQQAVCDTHFQRNKTSNKTTVGFFKGLSVAVFKKITESLLDLHGMVFLRLTKCSNMVWGVEPHKVESKVFTVGRCWRWVCVKRKCGF